MRSWKELIEIESQKPYYREKLKPFVEAEYAACKVFPERRNIYRALELTPLQEVSVLICGQDPYHEEHQAMGLAFSVPDGVQIPPSLMNIIWNVGRSRECCCSTPC